MLTVDRIRIVVEIDFFDDPEGEIKAAVEDLQAALDERVDLEEYLEGSIGVCTERDWDFDVRDATA